MNCQLKLLLAVLIACLLAACGDLVPKIEETSGLRFFYCIHSEQNCADTAKHNIQVKSGNALSVARRALSTKDDFVGFSDADDTILQFYAEHADSILVDMPERNLKGSYQTHVNRAQALKLVADLSPPLSRYRSDLKLKFAKWK